MSTTFPRTKRTRRGYNVAEVEDFLASARTAYAAEAGAPTALKASAIRTMAFSLERGGYSMAHVDSALERLEDAFAKREKDRAFAQPGGDAEWYTAARSTAQVLLDRFDRPIRQRFSRVGPLSVGYNTKDVDTFADRLADYFQRGKALSVDDVRSVVFRSAKGGYSESQVDVVLDTVISVMLAVK